MSLASNACKAAALPVGSGNAEVSRLMRGRLVVECSGLEADAGIPGYGMQLCSGRCVEFFCLSLVVSRISSADMMDMQHSTIRPQSLSMKSRHTDYQDSYSAQWCGEICSDNE